MELKPIKMMMMMNRKYSLVLFLFILSSVSVFSQDDFGIWLGADLSHKIYRNLSAEISGSLRTNEKTSVVDQYFAEGGLSYKFNKYLSIGSSYRLINKIEDNTDYYFRHKFFLSVKAEIPAGRFDLSARLQYQRTVKTYIENDNDIIPQDIMRLRVKAEYDFQSSPLKPYLYYEPFLSLKDGNNTGLKKTRYSAGTAIKISSKSRIEAGYIFENVRETGSTDSHFISLRYMFKF